MTKRETRLLQVAALMQSHHLASLGALSREIEEKQQTIAELRTKRDQTVNDVAFASAGLETGWRALCDRRIKEENARMATLRAIEISQRQRAKQALARNEIIKRLVDQSSNPGSR